MHEESDIPNTHELGSEEYFDEISKKTRKSQPINFEGTLWETLDQKPQIGNRFFMDSLLFESCKIKAEKELSSGEGEEEEGSDEKEEIENKIIELYEEAEGDIEIFNIGNYVQATKRQIQDLTFKNRMFRLNVNIVSLEIEFFPVGFGLSPVPYVKTNTFTTIATTFPRFTENYERMTGQRHVGQGLVVDTTRILNQRNGRDLVKAFAVGNGFTTNGFGVPIGEIPFAGLSLPLLFQQSANPLETPIAGFGFINEIEFNNDNEIVKDVRNWSLSDELERHENGKIEKNKLSLLAQETLKSINKEGDDSSE